MEFTIVEGKKLNSFIYELDEYLNIKVRASEIK